MAYVDCSIRFDDEWKLDGDDCTYDRVFIITYKVANSISIVNMLERREFYCNLGSEPSDDLKYKLSEGSLKKTGTTYTYSFKLTPEQLAEARINGVLTISAWVKAKYKNNNIIYEAKISSSGAPVDIIELPPKPASKDDLNLTIAQYTNTPGKFKCSWIAPSLYDNKPDAEAINGYCIRLEHNGRRVRGLKLTSGKLVKDSNYKELTYVDISGRTKEQQKSFIEDNNITFAGPNCSSTDIEADEVYLAGTSFDFVPKELGIESGDEYIFTIYPYNNIGTYIVDNGNGTGSTAVGTRLTNDGTTNKAKTSKGIVRVKHNDNWEEGQVWVMHNGVWKQAKAVYTMKDGKWLEAK